MVNLGGKTVFLDESVVGCLDIGLTLSKQLVFLGFACFIFQDNMFGKPNIDLTVGIVR